MKAEYIYELSSNNLPDEEEEEEDDDEDDVIVKSEPRMFGILSDQLFMEIKDMMLTFTTSDRFYPFDLFALWGMAGIGKTTLASKLYQDPSVLSYYGYCAFVTVGPEYELEDVFLHLLKQLDPNSIDDEEIIMLLEGDHQEKLGRLKWRLNECLKDRLSLIVLDDIWDKEMLGRLFNDRDESTVCTVLITTRLGIVAKSMSYWTIPFMDKKDSWDLLCAKVFGEDFALCTPQLERAGKKIAENCEGLPLTIVTVANILSKLERTPEHWNKVAANKQHSVYTKAYAKMHEVLLPSYYCLPQYLRISFLYMGLFPQNTLHQAPHVVDG